MRPRVCATSEARPSFRLLAGILSVLMLLIGLPVTVFMAIGGSPYRWLDVLTMVIVMAGFGSVACTGRWLCFRKSHD
jgi:steroid 5-alpha reductase family enzyme